MTRPAARRSSGEVCVDGERQQFKAQAFGLICASQATRMTDRVQQVVSVLDGYRCAEQGCSVLVMGVHQTPDTNWIQLHTVGAVETDILLRLSREATPVDAIDSLRGALRDKGLRLSA